MNSPETEKDTGLSDLVLISAGNDTGQSVSWKLNLARGTGFHDFIYSFLDSNQLYEPDVTGFLARALRPGDMFVDVGANLGWFTCLAASAVGPGGGVFAFEPAQENVRELSRNAALNSFTNVTIVEKAVADATGEVQFFINSNNPAGHALWDPEHYPGNAPARGVVSVPAVSLDDYFVPTNIRIRALKVDTEGAEKVLRGAECLLQMSQIDFVVAELHGLGLRELGNSQMTLREFMASVGYECFLLTASGQYPRQVHEGVPIDSNFIVNLLFCKTSLLAEVWPRFVVDEDAAELARPRVSLRLVAVLNRLAAQRQPPKYLFVDNGSKFSG